MPIWRLTIFIYLSLGISNTNAQYLFDNLKTGDGLSAREARCVYRDAEGFMWVGTSNGLNRFDGSHFRIWNHADKAYPRDIGINVNCIAESGKDKIWFGTNDGVGLFNKSTFSFHKIPIRAPGAVTPEKIYVVSLKTDRAGLLWMATNKGVYIERNNEFVPTSLVFPFATQVDNLWCNFLTYDSLRNMVWVGTRNGLHAIDLEKKEVFSGKNNPGKFPFFHAHLITAMSFGLKGDIWWGEANALNNYDFNSGKTERITHINNNPAWELGGGPNHLFTDRTGRLWISSWLYTVFTRDSTGYFSEVPFDQHLPYSIGYGHFSDAIQDNFGDVWLATINGVSRFSSNRFVENIIKVPTYEFYLPTGYANINSVAQGKNGDWWLGKMEGLVHYDAAREKFELYKVHGGLTRDNEIFDVDTINNEIWCSTNNGIRIFNPITKQFRLFPYYPEGKGSVIKSVIWIFRDSKGFIWSSVWSDAVYRYDPVSKECIRFDGTDPFMGDIATGNSSTIFETARGDLWFTIREKGIRIFDHAKGKFEKPIDTRLLHGNYNAIAQDSKGHMWLSSTRNTILECDSRGEVIDSITTKHGLTGNFFNDLCFDHAGRLWAISRELMICIETSTKQVVAVNPDITFSFNGHWNSLYRSGDKLYAAMLDNIVIIDTRKFQQLPVQVPPLISSFKVFQNDRAYIRNEPVSLAYSENFFSIDFSSPFHREYSNIIYAYKLEGFDKDWVYSGRKQIAEYTNVPDGNYTFYVKSTGGGNEWMDISSSITIHIKPPFWKTWWFLLLVFMALTMMGWWLILLGKKARMKKEVDRTIDYFANSVYGENSVNEICWDIARNCISQLHFEDCVVYLVDKEKQTLVQKAAYGPKNPKGHEIENPLEIRMGEGIVGWVAKEGKPLLVPDTSKDTRYLVDDERRYSELAVPILHDNEVIGVIDSENSRKNFFTAEHLKTMVIIASISSNKIAEALAESSAKDKEIKLLEINKMLAESQLMALRAQMNPHFVFNCLNSIQECIVTKKYGEASNYLNKFSRLFRMVLNNSGKNLVSIEEEKEVLSLYLELELMRFDKSFNYTIDVDEKLEIEEILIPSMLLQPYVENALWHGLMHKEGERKLVIGFKKISDEVFRCTIDDNGIGRKRSFELKEQQSKSRRHESKGLKISKDRLDVLQKQGYHAKLDIIDKYNGSGEACGTTVIIELSNYLNY